MFLISSSLLRNGQKKQLKIEEDVKGKKKYIFYDNDSNIIQNIFIMY